MSNSAKVTVYPSSYVNNIDSDKLKVWKVALITSQTVDNGRSPLLQYEDTQGNCECPMFVWSSAEFPHQTQPQCQQ